VPIYEFVCEACGRLVEVMQKVNDPPPAACPECGGDRLARTVSRTSFQLKGGGWYSDLYASAKEKPKPGGAEPSTATPAASTAAATPGTAGASTTPASAPAPKAPASPAGGGSGSGGSSGSSGT